MKYNLYWGDLHNHNSVGLFNYSKGSIERTIDIARSHLDFFAFSGHSYWHDMPRMPNDGHLKWQEGFDYHTKMWPKVKKLIAQTNDDGHFVAFQGYEWHSAQYGDRTVLFKDDDCDLLHADSLEELAAYARKKDAILIPHHIGYKSGLPGRGANWDSIDETVSPLLEVYSEHGGHERDRGPWPYIRHTNGPRTTRNTLQYGLSIGKKLGVICSTDDHFGYPGAYGEGLAAVYAEEQSRPSIWDALKSRRTYGVTGDRIKLMFALNDEVMGSILPQSRDRTLSIRVEGWDDVAIIELLKNNRVIHRHFPEDHADPNDLFSAPVKCRIEFGWGPWKALGIPRLADWLMEARVERGRLKSFMPCFQSGPMDENRRNRIVGFNEKSCRWKSYTSREGSFAETPTNAVVLEIEGTSETTLHLNIDSPEKTSFHYSLAALAASSAVEFMGDFPSESLLVHRLVPQDMYSADFSLEDTGVSGDYYYVRVTQSNGQMAWSSPIWLE